MRFALDATPLTLSSGGLARYTDEISRSLASQFPEDEFVLMSDQPFALPCDAPANLRRGDVPRNYLERRWWSWGLSRALARSGSTLFHGTDFAVPYLPLRPSVLTLHDLSPWMDPRWHHAAQRVRRRAPFLIGLGIATMLLTDSEAVRRQAIDHFRIHPSRIVKVPLAASTHFQPVAAPSTGPPYFLYLGALEPRKNIRALVEPWREVRRTYKVDLVLAGLRRADFPELPPEPGLQILGEVSDERLPALYSGALAFVYPSLYEGFGLPVLEAMQCGACVITSRDAAIAEVAGDAAVRVEPGREMSEAMLRAAADPEWVSRRRTASLHRAAAFSWARTARRTREVYDEARKRFD